ncbi:STP1 protein, partial [Plasmodium ovale]
MQRGQYNCDKIKAASQKKTNDIFIRYKTPILEGAIKLINQFKKDKDDGVHYKKLCEELLKYVKAQKKCVREEVSNEGKSLTAREWNKIVNALYITLNSQRIKSLCYLEKDDEETKKKEVLNIHEVFRNFCIEKKAHLRNISDMNFEQCNDYMSWITEKKRGLQAIDPNYENIREYKEYFDIHHNCNYPWLVSNTPDVTCSQITRSRGKEKEGASKSAGDSSQTAPPTIPDSTINAKKDIPLSPTDSFKGELVPASNKYPNISPEIAPKKIGSPPDDANTVKDNVTPKIEEIGITGTDISKYPSNSYTKPNYADIKRFPIHKAPDIFIDGRPVQVQDIQIDPTAINSYTWSPLPFPSPQVFPPPYPRSKRFPSSDIHVQSHKTGIPPVEKYTPKTKPWRTPASFFDHELPPFITSSTGNKKLDRVFLEPALPDASYFRSPSMIYTLVFLTIFTIISTFYLFSKYTSFGLLFSKKKKKKRLKRQLEIKKIPEESPSFDKITNYSVNDIPHKNKTHDDNNIYSKIKIQKSVLKKNISLPKKKKNKSKAIIDIHMELLNEYKNDEWELNKNDFLQICLEEFVREQNKVYSNSENTNIVMKNISIQNTKEDKMVLLDKWTERCRPIWEKFKSENAFKVLQYEWKEAEKKYLENIEQL